MTTKTNRSATQAAARPKTPQTKTRTAKAPVALAATAQLKKMKVAATPAASKRKAPACTATGTTVAIAPTPTPSGSKQARLIELLGSGPGATIEQMMALTGWQAHTVHVTISGALHKRLGLDVQSAAPDSGGMRLYRIVATEARAPRA